MPQDEYAWNMDIAFEVEKDERSAIRQAEKKEAERKKGRGASLKLAEAKALEQAEELDLPSQSEQEEGKSKAKQLIEKKREGLQLTAVDLATTHKQQSKYHLDGWNYAPTRKEVERWQRQWEKAQKQKDPREEPVKRPSPRDVISRAAPSRELSEEERYERYRQSQVEYESLKRNLVLTTAGIAGVGTLLSGLLGGVDSGASFAIGSLGAVVYLRLLARKADSKGSDGSGGGGGGPPSILVPAILFMGYNRWNTLAGPEVDHYASLLPLFLGFFTYKPVTLLQAFKDLSKDDEGQEEGGRSSEKE